MTKSKITAEYKRVWMAALKECLKQKRYGDSDSCALCNVVERCRKGYMRCNKCICLKVPPKTHCLGRITVIDWPVRLCRAELRKMLAWLEKQKVTE